MGEEDLVDFPSCRSAGELRLFFRRFCSQSPVCTEQVQLRFKSQSFGKPKPQVCWEWDLTRGPLGLPAPFSWRKHGRM